MKAQFKEQTKLSTPLLAFYVLSFFVLLSALGAMIFSFNYIKDYNHLYKEHAFTIYKHEHEKENIEVTEFDQYFLQSVEYVKSTDKHKRDLTIVTIVFILFLLIWTYLTHRLYTSLRTEHILNTQRNNFLLSITHELKTPIAAIQMSVATVKDRQLTAEKQQRLLTNALQSSERLDSLVDNILLAAKLENEDPHFVQEEMNISMLAEEIAVQYENSFGQKRAFSDEIEDGLYVNGDATALSSIISNLLENAYKYSKINTKISLKVFEYKKDKVRIEVADEGVGIPNEQKEKVFDKFHRVNSEATRTAKGTGLGLFIVKELVIFHNGSVFVKDNEQQGSIFVVDIPLLAEAE